jgi:DNA-binding response OmpR family regulator
MARIIIADDDEIVGEIAQDTLIAAGHGVGLLPDGMNVIAVLRQKRSDLVILDCNMPELRGLLVLPEMRNSVDLCDMPVLILTGRRSDQDVELAMYAGANDYLKKPFEPDELVFRSRRYSRNTRLSSDRPPAADPHALSPNFRL